MLIAGYCLLVVGPVALAALLAARGRAEADVLRVGTQSSVAVATRTMASLRLACLALENASTLGPVMTRTAVADALTQLDRVVRAARLRHALFPHCPTPAMRLRPGLRLLLWASRVLPKHVVVGLLVCRPAQTVVELSELMESAIRDYHLTGTQDALVDAFAAELVRLGAISIDDLERPEHPSEC